MDLILVKIFATALALSEVMTQPQDVKTHFDAAADQAKVVQLLRAGCAHMRKAFDIESINVDDLITTARNDQKAVGTGIKAFHGINFADLNVAYHQFCKNENVGGSVVDVGQVIEFFNDAAGDLPDHTRLKGRKLPSMSAILDGKGANFADVFEPGNRRVWVSLADIPESVQKAFVAAEDGASTSIMASTSAASSARSWAISAIQGGRRSRCPKMSRPHGGDAGDSGLA